MDVLRRWAGGVDLFERSYICVPIHDRWVVVMGIICSFCCHSVIHNFLSSGCIGVWSLLAFPRLLLSEKQFQGILVSYILIRCPRLGVIHPRKFSGY